MGDEGWGMRVEGAVTPMPFPSLIPHPSSQFAVPDRNAEGERAPHPGRRVHVNTSAEELGEAARVVEAEPRTAMSPSEPSVELRARMEEPRSVGGVDADARVTHLDAHFTVATLDRQGDSAPVRELDRVVHE